MKRAIQSALRLGAKGIKIVSGRLGSRNSRMRYREIVFYLLRNIH